ncbi:hypothetical protein BIV23_07905 [Streptomyces monashensis]|uniref:Major facilitator superfamily (MFS) profile domain-containing protein n=1 Tax=Streptomyces monashensis TaxID=1678012 RepID=A0A1S2QJG5_9ACTN|nr:hypothetical protein BIV23_07905 [Streptomyces monashensis]
MSLGASASSGISIRLLVVARAVQGIGAALLTSQVLTGIRLNFQGVARSRALGPVHGGAVG